MYEFLVNYKFFALVSVYELLGTSDGTAKKMDYGIRGKYNFDTRGEQKRSNDTFTLFLKIP